MKEYSVQWNEIFNKQSELNDLKYEYLRRDPDSIISDLKLSLKESSRILIGLEFLLNLPDNFKQECFDRLIFLAVYGSPGTIGEARDVIESMGREWLEDNISAEIEKMLNLEIEKGYEDYLLRNIAYLFVELRFKDKLKEFLEQYCRNSDNADINEIFDDYISCT